MILKKSSNSMIKTLIILFIFSIMIFITTKSIAWTEKGDWSNAGYGSMNPYDSSYYGPDWRGNGWIYHSGNCTWYCWGRAYEKLGHQLPGWGNAGNWYSDAQKSGYAVGSEPRSDSIIVWSGHVAYVEYVEGTNIQITECNWAAGDNTSTHDFNYAILDQGTWQGSRAGYFIGFIYLNTTPPQPVDNYPEVQNYILHTASATANSMEARIWATDDKGINSVSMRIWQSGKDENTGFVKTWQKNGSNNTAQYVDGYFKASFTTSEVTRNATIEPGSLVCVRFCVTDTAGHETIKYLYDMAFAGKANLGNFSARIVPKSSTGFCLGLSATKKDNLDNNFLELQTKKLTDASQIWKFERQSNGLYKITNYSKTGKTIHTNGGVGAIDNGSLIKIYDYNANETALHRYLLQTYNGGYRIVPGHTPDLKALDITDGTMQAGQPIELYRTYSWTNAAQTFVFEKIADSMTLNNTSTQLYVGNTLTLKATITPSDVATKNVTWKSSNTSIATVDSAGKVTAKGIGTATITATTTDGSNISKTCTVKVIEDIYDPNAELVLNKYTYQFDNLNASYQLKSTLSTGKDTQVTWRSSNTNVATVDSTGKVTSKKGGFAYIYANSKNYGELYCLVYVSYPVTLSDGAKVYVGDLDGNGLFDANDSSLILDMFKTNDTSADSKLMADLNGDGKVNSIDSSIVLEAAQTEAFRTGNLATIRYVTISKNKAQINIGETFKLTASTVASKTYQSTAISWSSSNSSIATVDGNGNVKGIEEGKAIITAKSSNGKTATCEVTVTFKLKFKDVPEGAWYYNSVKYVFRKGYITGYNDTTFGPSDNLTREQLVNILWRIEGKPSANSLPNRFTDVQNGAWYTDAIKWANAYGIVNGYGGTTKFGVGDKIIRQDLAIILSKYAEYKGKDMTKTASLDVFKDKNKVSSYAVNAVKWAVTKGIITGNTFPDGSKTIAPHDNATRAETAVMLQRFCENILK